jgi:hypothetical protein
MFLLGIVVCVSYSEQHEPLAAFELADKRCNPVERPSHRWGVLEALAFVVPEYLDLDTLAEIETAYQGRLDTVGCFAESDSLFPYSSFRKYRCKAVFHTENSN